MLYHLLFAKKKLVKIKVNTDIRIKMPINLYGIHLINPKNVKKNHSGIIFSGVDVIEAKIKDSS